jgi:Mg/Co/Ni transporter MgtE
MKEQKSNSNPNQMQKLAAAHAGELKNLVGSDDGQKVKQIMQQDAAELKKAMEQGDMSALKRTFDNLMRTEEGARLIGKMQDMMK